MNLNIIFLTDFLRKRERNRIRAKMRGYQKLKESGQLDKIANIKRILTEQKLNLNEKDFSSSIMGEGMVSAELIVRQYLIIRVCSLDFNKVLLRSIGNNNEKVIYGIPREWRKTINEHGFETDNFLSEVYWRFYVLTSIAYGIVRIITNVFQSMFFLRKNIIRPKSHVYFENLSAENIPVSDNKTQTHNIISWYLKSKVKQNGIDEVYHSAKQNYRIKIDEIDVFSRKNSIPNLVSFNAILKYCCWSVRGAFIALFDLLRGHWWNAIMFNQATFAAKIRLLPQKFLAKEYLFHQTQQFYRPLWTYEAAKKNSIITLYYYATNCEGFKSKDSYPELFYGWKNMNWPNYLVWDNYQSNFIKRAAKLPYKINIVGPIYLLGKVSVLPKFDKKIISIFDVTPRRDSYYVNFAEDFDYVFFETCNQFLKDCYDIITSMDYLYMHKRKRNIGLQTHRRYNKLVESIDENTNVIKVSPDESALNVIESSFAVISMPFTSTALIARDAGKPSIYYDPNGQIQKDDIAAHGIPVITGRDELYQWILKLSKTNQNNE